ncbi:MAG: DUF1616 domain-containing protein, partial [Methanobacterium sp.]|nr:DUF1616 domain-containing protein [Methanobacterium sp.]
MLLVIIVRTIMILRIKRQEVTPPEEDKTPEDNTKKLMETSRSAARKKDVFQESNTSPSPKKVEITKIKESSRDLLILLIITLICGGIIYFIADSLIRIPFALGLAFFLPGYALLSLLKLSYREKKGFIRIIAALGLSFSITMIVGVIFNFLNYDMSSQSILLILMGISLISTFLAYIRRYIHHQRLLKTIKPQAKIFTPSENTMRIYKPEEARQSTEKKSSVSKRLQSMVKSSSQKDIPEKEDDLSDALLSEKSSLSLPSGEVNKFRNLTNFFKSPGGLVVVLSILGVLFAFIPFNLISVNNQNLLRIVFTIPLVLFLPGFAILKGISSPQKSKKSVKRKIVIFVFSVILSILLALGLGMLLTPFLEQGELCIILLAFISLAGVGTYYFRKRRLSGLPGEKEVPEIGLEEEEEFRAYDDELEPEPEP